MSDELDDLIEPGLLAATAAIDAVGPDMSIESYARAALRAAYPHIAADVLRVAHYEIGQTLHRDGNVYVALLDRADQLDPLHIGGLR